MCVRVCVLLYRRSILMNKIGLCERNMADSNMTCIGILYCCFAFYMCTECILHICYTFDVERVISVCAA